MTVVGLNVTEISIFELLRALIYPRVGIAHGLNSAPFVVGFSLASRVG